MVVIVLGFFLVCWLPFMVVTVVDYTMTPSELRDNISSIAVFVGVLNSGVNPFIYNFRNTEFRLAFHKLLRVKYQGTAVASSLMLESYNVSVAVAPVAPPEAVERFDNGCVVDERTASHQATELSMGDESRHSHQAVFT